ncbi:MAG: hypothetical protein JXR96_20025 [Deltaproteobacteria bacterium]|nr:hypothetical protein [Deltaproteobacteria bacterium]
MRRTTKRTLVGLAVLAALASMPACYPETEAQGLWIDLGDLGVCEQDLSGWIQWLDFHAGWDLPPVYEMSTDASFFMALHIWDVGSSKPKELKYAGGDVSRTDGEVSFFIVPREYSSTALYQIETAIFWLHQLGQEPDSVLEVFSGRSSSFLMSEYMSVDSPSLDIQAGMLDQASVLVRHPQVLQGAYAAVQDKTERVRLPRSAFEPAQDGSQAVLGSLPVGRRLLVEMSTDGWSYETLTELSLDQAGMQVEVDVEP